MVNVFKRRLFPVVILAGILGACSGETFTGDEANIHGGMSRANSFENFEPFVYGDYNIESFTPKDSSGAPVAPLVISNFRTYLATFKGSVMLKSQQGVVWEAELDGNAIAAAGMCTDEKQNLYVIASDGALYSFDVSGTRRFKKQISSGDMNLVLFPDLLAMSDGIVAGASSGEVLKISFDGKVIWQRDSPFAPTGFASDGAGVFIGLSGNTFATTDSLLYIQPDGRQLWERPFENMRIIHTPVVSGGKIFLTGVRSAQNERMPVVHVLDMTGRVMWSRELAVTPRGVSVAADGTIYVAGSQASVGESRGAVTSLSADGSRNWTMFFDMNIVTPAMISADVVACVGTKGRALGLYALNRTDGELRTVLSLSEAPLLYPQPGMSPDGSLVFAGSERAGIIRTVEGLMQRLRVF
ncbi:MAG TPA: PQQ-binding-like beta-propeller repeat protein [Patescibacteria group bacterium]|nr:PQQ-binding-like beta-propeller repeat protein [Patescibacteria group bacterium]